MLSTPPPNTATSPGPEGTPGQWLLCLSPEHISSQAARHQLPRNLLVCSKTDLFHWDLLCLLAYSDPLIKL